MADSTAALFTRVGIGEFVVGVGDGVRRCGVAEILFMFTKNPLINELGCRVQVKELMSYRRLRSFNFNLVLISRGRCFYIFLKQNIVEVEG